MSNPFEVPKIPQPDDAVTRARRMSHDRDTIDRTKYLDVKDRGIDRYEKELGFSAPELAGKVVLNLGSGERLTLEKELKDAGIEADIVSLSVDYADEKHREKILKEKSVIARVKNKVFQTETEQEYVVPGAMPVSALAQQLPFPNETFDTILCNHVMEHVRDIEAKLEILREIIRVLRVGGRAHVSPFHDYLDGKITDKIQEILPEGVTMSFSETGGMATVYDEYSWKHKMPLFRVMLTKEGQGGELSDK